MTVAPIHTPTPEQVRLATDWHGGQGSMLYAVSSTGALSRGTIRPYGDAGPMTDNEWDAHLLRLLDIEVAEIARLSLDHPDTTPAEREDLAQWSATLRAMTETF